MMLGQHEPGTFAVLHIDEDVHDSIHLLEKEKGFREYFEEKSKVPFEIVDFNLNPHEGAFRTQMSQLLNNNNLKGIYVSTSKGTALIASVLEGHGKKDIRMIGYDILSENLKYLGRNHRFSD
jgi:LacI family transcriptional regulator